MSDMQLYLIALGAGIIAAVIIFNWWQERRFGQEAARGFDEPVDDALMENFRINRDRPMAFDDKAIVLDERFDAQHTFQEPKPESKAVPEPEPEEPHLKDIPEDTLLSELPGVVTNEFASDVTARIETHEASPSRQPNFDSVPFEEAEYLPIIPAAVDLPSELDEKIDLIALMHFNNPLTDVMLKKAISDLPRLDKPMQWLARDDAEIWRALTTTSDAGWFLHMACALQLSDRSGSLSRDSLRKFQIMMETLAESLGALLEWRGTNDPLRYADELDQFCINVDVMVGFHLVHGANGPFTATKLRGIAEAGGMLLHEDGTFHYITDSGDTLFILQNHESRPFTPEFMRTAFIRGISFQMDVPRVKNCPEAFNQMVMLARKMEKSLDGVLMDDKQQPLNTEAMDKIREQLRIINGNMLARGIIPGSPSALRLFS